MVLLLALALGVPLGGVATAQETPEPELTWAPLVTLPPIVAPPISSRVDLADGFRLGDADAPVAIEVWEDFQCPYCQAFTFQIEPALVERFVGTGQASLTFRQLPFLGEESRWAAVAASLAAEQDLFWPFHDYLFSNLLGENVGSYGLERLLAMGEAAGLDIAINSGRASRWSRPVSGSPRSRPNPARMLRRGASGTPTVTVNGVPLRSPDFDTVAAAIEAALADVAATPAAATVAPEVSPSPR